jgi:hypothetical protein
VVAKKLNQDFFDQNERIFVIDSLGHKKARLQFVDQLLFVFGFEAAELRNKHVVLSLTEGVLADLIHHSLWFLSERAQAFDLRVFKKWGVSEHSHICGPKVGMEVQLCLTVSCEGQRQVILMEHELTVAFLVRDSEQFLRQFSRCGCL